VSTFCGVPFPIAYYLEPISIRHAESPFRGPEVLIPTQVHVESSSARFRELLILHFECEGYPSASPATRNHNIPTGEEGVETACRKDQFQGLGDRRIGLIKLNLDSGSTRYRFALDLLRFNRLNRLSISIIMPLRGAQFFEDRLPPSVADLGKVAFDCLHR